MTAGRIRFGAMNSPLLPVLSEIETIGGMGFDYLELTLDPPHAHYSQVLRQKAEIRDALDRWNMALVCHLPTFVYTADLTESIRQASLTEMRRSLDTAAELGMDKAVLHPPYLMGLARMVKDLAMGHVMNSLTTITAHAADAGITLCLENMPPQAGGFMTPDDFAIVFQRFPSLKMTLDVGHAHIGDPNGRRSLDFIDRFGDRIDHLHISDNAGKCDDHQPLGKGTAPLRWIAAALNRITYSGTATFEIFTERRKDMAESRERFQRMINS